MIDLIIDPFLMKILCKNNLNFLKRLKLIYNVLIFDDLNVKKNYEICIFKYTTKTITKKVVTLYPNNNNNNNDDDDDDDDEDNDNNVVGKIITNPRFTGYKFLENINIYNISNKNPRIVLWLKKNFKILPICTSVLILINDDYAEFFLILEKLILNYERNLFLNNFVNSYSSSFFPQQEPLKIIVFDLDRTLIDDDNDIIKNTEKVLQYCRGVFDLIVLWSHASALHVDENVEKLQKKAKICFDLVLHNNSSSSSSSDKKYCKNLLHLYNLLNLGNVFFKTAILVDDSLFNWSPEYTAFIVPLYDKKTNGKNCDNLNLIPLINKHLL